MSDESQPRMTIWASEELTDRVESELSYGDNKSEWARQALTLRLTIEAELKRQGVEQPTEWADREDLIVDLLRQGIRAAEE